MKNVLALITVLFIGGITNSTVAQNRKEVKKEIKSVKKEVRIEENNGTKTLTIETDENGKKTKEVYTGNDADKKMNELNNSQGSSVPTTIERQEVIVRKSANDKKVTIRSSINGNTRVEEYTGRDADVKIKEMEKNSSRGSVKTNKKTKVKKRKKAKSKLILQEKK